MHYCNCYWGSAFHLGNMRKCLKVHLVKYHVKTHKVGMSGKSFSVNRHFYQKVFFYNYS